MNVADDKKSSNKSNKINGSNSDAIACSSEIVPQKVNGTNCNKHPITNGAYSKVNSVPCGIPSSCGSDELSCTRKNNSTQISCGNGENVLGRRESGNGLLLRNSADCSKNIQNQPKLHDKAVFEYDRNSSSEDEECCIYTYKGDSNQMADLPSSFFRLDLMPSRPNGNSRNSSPDMDYLEMDFDPGPSNDRFSSSDSECNDERETEERLAVEAMFQEERNATPEPDANPPTPLSPLSTPSPVWSPRPPSSQGQPCPPVWSPPPSPQRHLQTDSEVLQPSYCYCIASKLSSMSIDENFNDGDTGTMIWKEQEAREKQVTQIATSACGATAVINTLLGLNTPFTLSAVKHHVATRLRADAAPLVEYLMSRSNAGATHVDMIQGLQGASQDLVYARFFHMYPQRSISLISWLSHWIRKGAVPIATLNLQRGVHTGQVPDMWHHQMIHGVSARGVFLTNPLEVQSEARLWPQLASPSELRVRRDDIISRWTPDTPLHPLISRDLPQWRRLNVLGQVVNVVRESSSGCGSRSQSTQHITIPASYSSGITIALLRTNPAFDELRFAPELPIDPFASS